jgi:hypothetical protein
MNLPKLLYLSIFITMSLCAFAENTAEGTGEPSTDIFVSSDTGTMQSLIVRQNSITYTPFNYQFLDGTPLVDKNKLRQILNIPGNEKLLKQEKGLRLMTNVFAVLCMAATAMHSRYIFLSDIPNRDSLMLACYIGEVVSLAATFWTGTAANNKIDRAVDNYNLYIMGIPIR